MSQQVLSFGVITAAADGSGDYTETTASSVNIRGELTQIEGYKKMAYTELLTKTVYQFDCYDSSSIVMGAAVTWGSVSLNIHAVIKNFDGSFTNKVRVILYK